MRQLSVQVQPPRVEVKPPGVGGLILTYPRPISGWSVTKLSHPSPLLPREPKSCPWQHQPPHETLLALWPPQSLRHTDDPHSTDLNWVRALPSKASPPFGQKPRLLTEGCPSQPLLPPPAPLVPPPPGCPGGSPLCFSDCQPLAPLGLPTGASRLSALPCPPLEPAPHFHRPEAFSDPTGHCTCLPVHELPLCW